MLGLWILTAYTAFVDGVNSAFAPHGTDFMFSQNTNILAVVSYMLQSNHFFPMDTYFAIGALYFVIYGFLGTVKVVEVVVNLVRGAGLRL